MLNQQTPSTARPSRRETLLRALTNRRVVDHEQGSMLLDVLIGIAIFGLMSLIATSGINGYRTRSYQSDAANDAKAIGLLAEADYTENDQYPFVADVKTATSSFYADSNEHLAAGNSVAWYTVATNGGSFSLCVEHKSGSTKNAYAIYDSIKGTVTKVGKGSGCPTGTDRDPTGPVDESGLEPSATPTPLPPATLGPDPVTSTPTPTIVPTSWGACATGVYMSNINVKSSDGSTVLYTYKRANWTATSSADGYVIETDQGFFVSPGTATQWQMSDKSDFKAFAVQAYTGGQPTSSDITANYACHVDPAVSIAATGQQSVAANTLTVLNLPAATMPQGNIAYGANYIQVNEDGWYKITGGLQWTNNATASRKYIAIGTGTTVAASYNASGPISDQNGVTGYAGENIAQVRFIPAGTKVWLCTYSEVAQNTNGANGGFTFLSVAKIAD